jgi:HPt (histidine-containing phosphotransfer) domain-containing protein
MPDHSVFPLEHADPPNRSFPPTVNHGKLAARRKEVGGSLKRILHKFLARLDDSLEAIAQAVEQKDPEALATHAHRLKGSSAMLGIEGLAALCRTLEQAGREGRLEETAPLVRRMRDEMQSIKPILQGEMEQEGP